MKEKIYIDSISYVLGDLQKLEEYEGYDSGYNVNNLYDMGYEYYSEISYSIPELAIKSINSTISKTSIAPESIDMVLVSSNTCDLNGFQSFLEKEFIKIGLNTQNIIFLSFGRCGSLINTLSVGKGLLYGGANNILTVTTDKFCATDTPRNGYDDTTFFSDGAASFILTKKHSLIELGPVLKKTNNSIQVKNFNGDARERLHTYNLFYGLLTDLQKSALENFDINLSTYDKLITHNVGIPAIQSMAEKLSVTLDDFYLQNVSKYAHVFSADCLINLYDYIQTRPMNTTDLNVACIATGMVSHGLFTVKIYG